jgi:hypothetical protein
LANDFLKHGAQVTGIRVEVQPRQAPPQEPSAKQARLSPPAADSLQALAKRLPDSRLRQALAELATRKTR